MTAIDSAVRAFSVTFYPPTVLQTVFFCAALAALVAAGTWLGMRAGLHLFGQKVEGRVVELVQRVPFIKGTEFTTSRFFYISYLKIEFTDAGGGNHSVKGKHYSNDDEQSSPRIPKVGGTVPVYYSKVFPSLSVYYDPVWHYLAPLAFFVIALLLSYGATKICYEDIRNSNVLALADSTREHFQEINRVIIDTTLAIHERPDDADALERLGDAQFAAAQFGDAITDYTDALRLRPEGRDLLRKRAKAEWLDGRDLAAFRDWMKSR